jgi:hypothetical protein
MKKKQIWISVSMLPGQPRLQNLAVEQAGLNLQAIHYDQLHEGRSAKLANKTEE